MAGEREHRRRLDARAGPGCQARARRRSTTRPGRDRWRTRDLVKRDFPAGKINCKWYGDGTEYLARRTAEGKTKPDAMRCLKRYIAREVFPHLIADTPARAASGLPSAQSAMTRAPVDSQLP